MSIFGLGTETYLYVNGLTINETIPISNNKTFMPVKCKLPLNTISKLIKSDVDFAIAILCSGSLSSQLKIEAENPKDLAISAWNSQWDLILLSAIFNCNCVCNLQCTQPLEEISSDSALQVANYHMQGLFNEPYTVTDENGKWINKYFSNAQALIENDSFMTAIHSMATYKWNPHPRVQLAILWAGIESLFRINSELSFRISLYISKFLSDKNIDEAKKIFDEVKSLYKARSSAVHGDNIKGDNTTLVVRSASLLNRLIVKCIEINGLPDVENLIY